MISSPIKELSPAQAEIVNSKKRFRVLCCGRRTGKTTLAIYEMLGAAMAYPGSIILYIAPTYQQARDIAWEALKNIARPNILDKNEARLELKVRAKEVSPGVFGESKILFRGWESIENVRGLGVKLMVLDEVSSYRNFWLHWQEVLRPALSDQLGEALFVSTPKGFNHFYDLFNMSLKDTDFASFRFTSYDNPHVPKEEIDKAKEEMPEDKFSQEYMADFRKATGLVYPEFDRKIHIIDKLPVEPIARYVGIDWGYTNPAAVLLILKDAEHNFYIAEEWYKTGKTTDEIVSVARSFDGNAYYPDPAEPDRIEELRKKGLHVREVNKDVKAGIDAVRGLLLTKKLFIHSSCVNLIEEIEKYSYHEKKADKNAPEVPIKEDDHLMDAMRYVLFMCSKKKGSGVNVFYPSFLQKQDPFFNPDQSPQSKINHVYHPSLYRIPSRPVFGQPS